MQNICKSSSHFMSQEAATDSVLMYVLALMAWLNVYCFSACWLSALMFWLASISVLLAFDMPNFSLYQ